MWNQTMHIWLGVDFPTTFSCRGNSKQKKMPDFVARSLTQEDGGSWYKLIAIVTDVGQDVNEGFDGVEHV